MVFGTFSLPDMASARNFSATHGIENDDDGDVDGYVGGDDDGVDV
jgi:hypothetical protein